LIVTEQGWNLAESTSHQIRLLEHLAETGSGSYYARLPEWAQDSSTDIHGQVTADLDNFEAHGLVTNSKSIGGPPQTRLLAPGKAKVEEIRAARADRAERNKQVRDAVLHWLYDRDLAGVHMPVMSDFTKTPFGLYYGVPFDGSEIGRATAWLESFGYITGIKSAEAGIIRASITPKGTQLAESDRSVNDPEPSQGGGVHLTINQHGDYAVAQAGGHGAVQSFTQTTVEDHKQQILGFAGALEELIRAKELSGASDLPDKIRNAVERNDQGTIARVLRGTRDYLEQHASTGLGALVLVELGNLMHTIGLS
jgi:hypothetical protein